MATKDPVRRFAEQSIEVDHVLHAHKVPGNSGHVLLVLFGANKAIGLTQKELLNELGLRKDGVSKLVTSLVRAGLLTKTRREEDPRAYRLEITKSGRALLGELENALHPSHSKPKVSKGLMFDFS